MLDIQDVPRPVAAEIKISIHFVDGNFFEQKLPVDDAHGVQAFLDWYRSPGRIKVWTWQIPSTAALHALHHAHITAIDVEGYVEPDGRSSRWYERLLDKWRVWRRLRHG